MKISEDISQIVKAQNDAIVKGLTPPPIDSIPFEDLRLEISSLRLCLVLESHESTEDELEESDDWQN